jgi:hypothetical protein
VAHAPLPRHTDRCAIAARNLLNPANPDSYSGYSGYWLLSTLSRAWPRTAGGLARDPQVQGRLAPEIWTSLVSSLPALAQHDVITDLAKCVLALLGLVRQAASKMQHDEPPQSGSYATARAAGEPYFDAAAESPIEQASPAVVGAMGCLVPPSMPSPFLPTMQLSEPRPAEAPTSLAASPRFVKRKGWVALERVTRLLNSLKELMHIDAATPTALNRLGHLSSRVAERLIAGTMVVTYFVDRTHVPFELVSMANAESVSYASLRRFHLQCGLVGQCAVSGLHMHVHRPHMHPSYNPKIDQHTSFPMGSMLLVPIRTSSNEIVGVMQFEHRLEAGISEDDASLGAELAGQVGAVFSVISVQKQAVASVSLVEETAERLKLVLDCISSIDDHISMPSLRSSIARVCAKLTKCDRTFIALLAPSSKDLVLHRGPAPPYA